MQAQLEKNIHNTSPELDQLRAAYCELLILQIQDKPLFQSQDFTHEISEFTDLVWWELITRKSWIDWGFNYLQQHSPQLSRSPKEYAAYFAQVLTQDWTPSIPIEARFLIQTLIKNLLTNGGGLSD